MEPSRAHVGGAKYFPRPALIAFPLREMGGWNPYYRILEVYFVIFRISGRGATVSIEKISNTGTGWMGGRGGPWAQIARYYCVWRVSGVITVPIHA